MIENFKENIDQVFLDNSQDVLVYLRASTTKGPNFDPERQAGYVVTLQNPMSVKAIVRTVSPESMILKELGQVDTDALELLIKDKDIDLIKLSEKIVVNGNDYYKFNESVGGKFLIWKRSFNYYRVWIWRKEK